MKSTPVAIAAVSSGIHDLEQAYEHAEITAENRDVHYEELVELRVSLGRLRDLCDEIDHRVAETFAYGQRHILGTQVYEAKPRTNRRNWQKEDLVEAVFDAVLVNRATGEIEPMTKLEKLRFVWPLANPRVTALRELGIDPDEYCQTETSRLWLAKVYR